MKLFLNLFLIITLVAGLGSFNCPVLAQQIELDDVSSAYCGLTIDETSQNKAYLTSRYATPLLNANLQSQIKPIKRNLRTNLLEVEFIQSDSPYLSILTPPPR